MQTLRTACKLYDDSSLLMGRSIAKGYYALLLAEQGEFEKARQALANAIECAARLSSPMESGLLARTQAAFLEKYPDEFRDMLPETFGRYEEITQLYLRPLPGAYELDYEL